MSVRSIVRKGFTLVELLVVITIILLISTLFLGLTPGDGGGLPAGQRFIASSIRTVRAMALMSRGPGDTGVSYCGRYRLLILNDPDDEVNHLRQFVIAVGGVSSADLGGADPSTITGTTVTPYKWFSPEPAQLLPNGVVFVPPASDTQTTMALTVAPNTRRSIIGQLADNVPATAKDSPVSTPPWMVYAPTNQPMILSDQTLDYNAKTWYYIELQGSGASNHLGRVLIVLAQGVVRNVGAKKAVIDASSETKFAAISLRPNGDVSMTLDADEMDKAK